MFDQVCSSATFCETINKRGTMHALHALYHTTMDWVAQLVSPNFSKKHLGIFLFGMILNIPINNFLVMLGQVFLG